MTEENPWRTIDSAPKDGTPVLLALKIPIPGSKFRGWACIQFVGIHPGLESDGFDVGWNFASPVGYGGFPDHWIAGWMPLPAPPAATHEASDGVIRTTTE